MFLTFCKLNPLKTLQSVTILHKENFQSVSNLYYFAYILSIFLSFVHRCTPLGFNGNNVTVVLKKVQMFK